MDKTEQNVVIEIGTVTPGLLKVLDDLEVGGRVESIIENGQNTEKSLVDLRRLAVTQIPVKNHLLTLMWKTLKGSNNNDNNHDNYNHHHLNNNHHHNAYHRHKNYYQNNHHHHNNNYHRHNKYNNHHHPQWEEPKRL